MVNDKSVNASYFATLLMQKNNFFPKKFVYSTIKK